MRLKNLRYRIRYIGKYFYKNLRVIIVPPKEEVPVGDCLTKGRYSYGKPILVRFFVNDSKLYIGNFCSISTNVTIFLGGYHRVDWVTTYPLRAKLDLEGKDKDGHPISKGDVIIGNDVWIAQDATILSGVTIGDGAVVGAGSIVTKNVDPYAIVAGNPHVVVRKRFSEDQIE